MNTPQKKRGCFGTVLLIFGVLMAISLVIGAIQATGRAIGVLPTLTPSATPTITPIPTVTPTPGPPTATPVPTNTPLPTPTPVPVTGVTFEQVCEVSERDMTDPQLKAHAEKFVGQTFGGWQGWVYDVASNGSGGYNLLIAMNERGFLWARNIEIRNIPDDLATRLNVEQLIVFDGRIAEVQYTFETMCNPLIVDNLVMR